MVLSVLENNRWFKSYSTLNNSDILFYSILYIINYVVSVHPSVHPCVCHGLETVITR